MRRILGLFLSLALFLFLPSLSAQPLPPPELPREARGAPANQQRYLPDTTYSDTDGDYGGDHFGAALDTDGNWMAVGSPDDDNNGGAGARRGSVDLFRRDSSSGAWVKIQTLQGATNSGYFGSSVSIWDNGAVGLLAVGSPGLSVSSQNAAGTVSIYLRTAPTVWSLEATLSAPVPEENARFGESVSISLSKIAIGAGGDRFGGVDMGAAYRFGARENPPL